MGFEPMVRHRRSRLSAAKESHSWLKYSYSFDYQKNSYFILGYDVGVQEGNIRKTMVARGPVNGRGPRSGRDLVFRCYPPELFSPPQKKTETDPFGSASLVFYGVRTDYFPRRIESISLLNFALSLDPTVIEGSALSGIYNIAGIELIPNALASS